MPQLPLGPGQAPWLLCSASPGLIRGQVLWPHGVTVQATLGRHSTSDWSNINSVCESGGAKTCVWAKRSVLWRVRDEQVHPCTGLAASQEGGKGHGSSGPSSRAATDLCTRLTLHTPGPCSPETILTTGASSWSSRGMELVFMGSNKPITPLLS